MEEFKKILSDEAVYKLPESVMDTFCSYMEEIKLKRYDPVIKLGSLDPNIYVIKEGIIRRTYED